MMKTIWWWKRLDDENDLMMKTTFIDEMRTIYLSTLNWVDKEFFFIFLHIASLEQTWQNSSNINFKIELRALINSIRSNINLRIEFELLFEIRFYDQTNLFNVILIYSMSMISRYAFNLTQTHWQTIKRIFRYLRKTYQMKLIFRETLKSLKDYTNSNYTKDQNIRRFIFEYAFNVNSEVINWFLKRQSIVRRFICEVEYTKQIVVAKKIIWLRNFMIQLTCDVEYSQAIIIYENNQEIIALTKNSQFHARIKHIDIQIHFIKEKMIEEFIN
jgi:hypothetical protein